MHCLVSERRGERTSLLVRPCENALDLSREKVSAGGSTTATFTMKSSRSSKVTKSFNRILR